MNEILISGYYGFKNSGDDALLLAIIQDIKREYPKAGITVLSCNPEETSRIYGVRSINRLNIFRIIPAMMKAKLLISGGGTLIQDGTSSKSLWYYLSVISAAKKLGVKVMLYANGIGPISREHNIKRTRKILNKVDLITLRDRLSETELKQIGVTKPKTIVTADPAFTLEASSKDKGRAILKQAGVDLQKKCFCISVRRWKTIPPGFEEAVAGAADYAAEKYGFFPVFLPMQLKKDYDISKRIAGKMKNRAVVLDQNYTAGDMLSIIANTQLCIGMRLHTLIYAASQCTPLVGLVYDPKISGFMEDMRQHYYQKVETVDRYSLQEMIDTVMCNYDTIKQELQMTQGQLRESAQDNARYAVRLLKGQAVTNE